MNKLILVCVSGGKDSTVTLVKAIKEYSIDKVKGIFCDTGWEHNVTYDYINYLQKKLNVEIIKLKDNLDMISLIRRVKNFPNFRWRFCSVNLKVNPIKFYLRSLLKQGKEVEIWFGIRKDESKSRNQIEKSVLKGNEHFKTLGKKDYKLFEKLIVKYPILNWKREDVFHFLEKEDIHLNPLYRFVDRVGCFPCFLSNKKEFELLFRDKVCGIERVKIIKQLEDEFQKIVKPKKSIRDYEKEFMNNGNFLNGHFEKEYQKFLEDWNKIKTYSN